MMASPPSSELDDQSPDGQTSQGEFKDTAKGRHRALSRWSRHRPAHEHPNSPLLTRLVPSWKFVDETTRPDRSDRPAAHRTEVIIDDTNGPIWDLSAADAPTIGVNLTDLVEPDVVEPDIAEPDVVFEPIAEESIDLSEEETVVDLRAVPVPIAVVPVEEIDRTDLLPSEVEEEDSGSIASLLGFSERQVNFVPDWARELETTGDTAWDSLPTLADVAVSDEPTSSTGSSVQRLWDATEDHTLVVAPLDESVEAPQPRLLDDQRFRRTATIALVVVAALIGLAAQFVGSQPERDAVAFEARYETAAAQITEATGPVSRSVALLTMEGISASDFAQLTGDLDVLDGIARGAAGIAAEALPEAPIVGSSLPIDSLILPKSLLEQSALQALNLESRIGDAVSYRIIFERAFDLPPLPTEATLVDIGVIGADLSVVIAENEQILAELPDDPFFGRHRQEAVDLLQYITESQAAYFDALRANDTFAATAIRNEITRRIAESWATLAEPLAATEAWAQTQVARLRETLAELTTLVSVEPLN
jgi:hypothetical protein